MRLANQRYQEFDTQSIRALTDRINAALIDANSTAVTTDTAELSKLLFGHGASALVTEINNATDHQLLEENVFSTLKAVDSLVSATEDFPGVVDLYKVGSAVGQLALLLKYRCESAEGNAMHLEAAVSAEMAAHTLERAAKILDVIERQVAAEFLKPGGNFVQVTLQGILDHKNDIVVISEYGEIRKHTGARRELLEIAGDNYDLASREVVVEVQDPIEAVKRSLKLRATAAVVLKEAGVSRRIRAKALGDCSVLAQTIAMEKMPDGAVFQERLRTDKEQPTNTYIIPWNLRERASEITKIAIEDAKARFNEFRFTPLSVDGILNV